MATKPMKITYRQSGQGMISFIIGLLLATVVIAGILFYLNKGKSDFKTPPTPAAPVKPEILTPDQIKLPEPEGRLPTTDLGDFTASHTIALPSDMASSVQSEDTGTKPPQTTAHPIPTPITPVPNAEHKSTTVRLPAVTPEQILNSGSLEKAQRDNKISTHKVILQIGAFGNQTDAEAQRAKLIMLGIDSYIQPAKINGAIKYRIQTNQINNTQANQIRETLRQHNIDSLIRSAS